MPKVREQVTAMCPAVIDLYKAGSDKEVYRYISNKFRD